MESLIGIGIFMSILLICVLFICYMDVVDEHEDEENQRQRTTCPSTPNATV